MPACQTLSGNDRRITVSVERCDRCIAEAMWAYSGPAGTLYFCGHHGRLHEAALTMAGFFKTDITLGAQILEGAH